MLGHRTKEEWAADFLDHEGHYPDGYPDSRELDEYMENNIAAKLRFFSLDYRQEINRMKESVKRATRDIESSEKSAFKIIAELMTEYEVSTRKARELNDSLGLENDGN